MTAEGNAAEGYTAEGNAAEGNRVPEALLAELGEALREADDVPARFVEVGRAAFAWRDPDAEMAALSHDSADSIAAESAGIRSAGGSRSLTFTAAGLVIEAELHSGALFGQVVPPQTGEIELRGQDGSVVAGEVDEIGWFSLRPIPGGRFRLRLRTGDGQSVLTEWVT